MFFCPCLASFASFSFNMLLFVLLLFCWFVSLFVACTCTKQGCMGQRHNLLSASKKGKDASPQRAMFSRLGGFPPIERSSLSLFLSLFSRAVLGSPSMYPILFPCSLLGLRSLGLAMFDLLSCSVWMHCAWCIYIYICKVEFNQSSCWLYSVPNLLVF